MATRLGRRERVERQARQEHLLVKSLEDMREAVDDLQDIDVVDIDEIVEGLGVVEKQLERAKHRAERIAGDDN